MGEAKQRSRHRSKILSGEVRCVYCLNPPDTVEHMPPTSMFPQRNRPSGMEFAACECCNHATRAADALASFVSRIAPSNVVDARELQEARRLLRTLQYISPECVREIFDERKAVRVWERGRDPIFGPKVQLVLDGPITTLMMRAFGAKLGMALFRELIGVPLPADGEVFTQHYFNQGLRRREAELMTSILPAFGELKQGKKISGKLFNYRYNTDFSSIVAALVAFNDNFFVRVFATSDLKLKEALRQHHSLPSVRLGGLSEIAALWTPKPIAPV